MLLRLENVARSFGSRTLFRDVALTIHQNDRIGLVGPNGTGKTTLMSIVAGLEAPDLGRVSVSRDVRVGMLRQEVDPSRTTSVRSEVGSVFSELASLERELGELETRMEEMAHAGTDLSQSLVDRYDDCRARFELGGGFEREARVERVLGGLGFDGERAGRPLSTFSGGWLMRVELAKLLLSTPAVLLLDEPTNHLDLPSIQWFEETLSEYPGAVVIISHDRTFLRRHVNRVAELEGGGLTVFDGDFDRYVSQKALRREELLARKQSQDRKITETERFIERFRYKASKAKQVQSRIKMLDKLDRVAVGDENRSKMRLKIPPVARTGESVLRVEGIEKSYGEIVVYRGVDLSIRRKERVALVGPNGAGKSTLLRIAAGVLPFDGGERTVGHNVTIAFYAQHQVEVLDARNTVLEELETVAQTDDIPRLRGQLGAFLFSGDDVQKKVEILSGGEKARLALAKLLLRPSNFLVLDEPTNHLDLVSREVLEDALSAYDGTMLLISHDRAFLNVLVNRVVEVDAGCLAEYPGNYDDYLRRKSPPPAPQEPQQATVSAAQQATVSAAKQATVSAAKQATLPAAPPATAGNVAAPLSKRERIAARELAKENSRRHQRNLKLLTKIEDEIREQEERLEALGWQLGDPDLHRDADGVRRLEAERSELRSAVDALYQQWERLAAEVEAGEQVQG